MISIKGKPYRELRCHACRKLICYEYVAAGRIAFLCSRCDHVSEFNFQYLKTKDVTDTMDKEFEIKALKGGGIT